MLILVLNYSVALAVVKYSNFDIDFKIRCEIYFFDLIMLVINN